MALLRRLILLPTTSASKNKPATVTTPGPQPGLQPGPQPGPQPGLQPGPQPQPNFLNFPNNNKISNVTIPDVCLSLFHPESDGDICDRCDRGM